jgi:hypothetical protein
MAEEARREIAERFRRKVLSAHTAGHRALQVERYLEEYRDGQRGRAA